MTSSRFIALGRSFFAIAFVAPGVLAGCEITVNGGSTCTVGDETHEEGDSFPSPDGCNSCTCLEDGEIACTLMGCEVGCSYGGGVAFPGESVPADDGCNTCICQHDGTLACTDMACVRCEYQGVLYSPGDTFPAGDGCNSCGCLEDGSVACTLVACPETCTYAGVEHQVGASFPALDGCNTCSCQAGGGVSCTEIACACEPANEWWHEYTSLDAQACLAINVACPINTVRFDSACGCGCEQDASCPEYFNCMPPAECDEQALLEQCPYSGIAY